MATVLLSLGSCGGQSAEQSRLAESQRSWAELKSVNGSSYRYTSRDASYTGYRWETTVEVRQDRVSRRSFKEETPTGTPAETWAEEGSDVGSHTRGAPALTIEGVYEKCAAEVLTKDPQANKITLTFHPNGLLEACVYFPKDCADDCSSGVVVSSLEFIH